MANNMHARMLATAADDGVWFNFVNGLDVDQATGDVYFTDSSATYPRRFNTEIMMNADATGRLLRYDARTGRVAVLKSGLPYPNGVAISRDGAHTVRCQAGQYELLADLPGYPDNVRRDGKGGYWVALDQEKQRLDLDAMPAAATAPLNAKHLVGVRLEAHVVEVEELTSAKGVTLSDMVERRGKLWLGSVEFEYVGVVALSGGVLNHQR